MAEIRRYQSGPRMAYTQRLLKEISIARLCLLDIQSKADATADALTPQLTSVTARLSELGAPPEGVKEAPDVSRLVRLAER